MDMLVPEAIPMYFGNDLVAAKTNEKYLRHEMLVGIAGDSKTIAVRGDSSEANHPEIQNKPMKGAIGRRCCVGWSLGYFSSKQPKAQRV